MDILKEIDGLKKEIDQYRPLSREMSRQLREYFRIGLTYTSNALEGNSLTEVETKVVLEEGITIGGKPLRDHFEALGHSEGYDYIHKLVKKQDITESNLKRIHKLFYRRIDEKNAGKYRMKKVIISGSKYIPPPPEKVPILMRKFIGNLPGMKEQHHPVVCSALTHKEFVFIHPFIDGNGRVARLLMNLILLQSGYPIAIIPPVVRANYLQNLEKAHSNDKPFIQLIAEMVREALWDYIRMLKGTDQKYSRE